MPQTQYFAFGYFQRGVSSRKSPLVEYGFDDWRDAVDTAVEELKNHLPELAQEFVELYDVLPHNFSREGEDGYTYFIEQIDEETFRRIEGLDLEHPQAPRDVDGEYFAGKYDHRPEEW